MSEQERGITAISVSGFKSLYDEHQIEIRPLTILAGANSSGKSSIMQPLLLMKQTLEASYDPGPLLLNGPNVRFTSFDQFIWSNSNQSKPRDIMIGIEVNLTNGAIFHFSQTNQDQQYPIQIAEIFSKSKQASIRPKMTEKEIKRAVPSMFEELRLTWEERSGDNLEWRVGRSRFFLGFQLYDVERESFITSPLFTDIGIDEGYIEEVIHLPGLRPNPQREQPFTLVDKEYITFAGTFEHYVAGIIHQWQQGLDTKYNQLIQNLKEIGLTSHIIARPLNDTQIEIRIGRTLQSDVNDTVSIADVGFGTSQIVPVLVALLVARPNQLVYLEQPELHLHPRAQVALAKVLADAAKRGVRVVAETHSSLLLLGIQTLIAEGELSPEKVMLHWFTRDEEGKTHIDSVQPDENGAYGEWPEDFADVELDAQSRYLDAVTSHEMGR